MPDLRISGVKVKEAMTQEFGIVNQSATLEQVINLLELNKWEEALVSDDQNNLVGIVTKKRLKRYLSNGKEKNISIGLLFRCNLITTFVDEDLIRARDVMRSHHIGRLPVLDEEGRVVGILTARDVCNGFSDKLAELGEHMFAILENISEGIQVVDCDGVVHF